MQPGAAQPVENPIISAPLPRTSSRRDPAIHEEVAPGDERAVGAHEQRADVPDRPACRLARLPRLRSCAGSPDHAGLGVHHWPGA